MKVKGCPVSLLGAAMLVACGPAQPSTVARIAPLAPNENGVRSLVNFVSQQCVGLSDDPLIFDKGMSASGWGFQRIQSVDPKNPLSVDVWRSKDVEVVRGEVVSGRVYICTVMVRPTIQLPVERLRGALSKLAGQQPNSDEEWWWQPDRLLKYHMDLSETSNEQNSLGITVEKYRLSLLQSILG